MAFVRVYFLSVVFGICCEWLLTVGNMIYRWVGTVGGYRYIIYQVSYHEVLVPASSRGFPNSLMGLSTGWWTHASYFSPRWPTCHARGFRQSTKSCWDTTNEKWVKHILYTYIWLCWRKHQEQLSQKRGCLKQVAAESYKLRLNKPGSDCLDVCIVFVLENIKHFKSKTIGLDTIISSLQAPHA